MHNFCFSDGGQTSMHFFYYSFSEFCVNVFQSLDRQSFVESFMVMLVVEKCNINEVSQFSLVLKRVVVLIIPFVCRRKLKNFHLSIHTMLWHQLSWVFSLFQIRLLSARIWCKRSSPSQLWCLVDWCPDLCWRLQRWRHSHTIPGDLLSFTSSQGIPRLFPEYCLGF